MPNHSSPARTPSSVITSRAMTEAGLMYERWMRRPSITSQKRMMDVLTSFRSMVRDFMEFWTIPVTMFFIHVTRISLNVKRDQGGGRNREHPAEIVALTDCAGIVIR